MIVRRLLYSMGYRYRLHWRSLPGAPDIVFPSRQKAVFVHGCYWHGHGCKRGGSGAKSNQTYWAPKIERTRLRDMQAIDRLAEIGWRSLVLWECEFADPAALRQRLESFLSETA